MDIEGFARRGFGRGMPEKDIVEKLAESILDIKFDGNPADKKRARLLASAVVDEVKMTLGGRDAFADTLLSFPKSGVSMGEFGVGSRGVGDFIVHRKIGKLASLGSAAEVGPDAQDDAGVVKTASGDFLVVAVDGTHSRLSEYPFVAGFHVARAAIRDVMVNGAWPAALLDDLHLSDDGDIGALFDFVSGVSVVSELTEVPIVAGSTLRTGGDMVIGQRMVSCVGCVGVLKSRREITQRKNVRAGDTVLMTEGAGGGTIATTAIYSGNFDVVKETLNLNFIKAANALLDAGLAKKIDAMLDVTNGGIRGDANEVCESAKCGLVFYEEKLMRLVNPNILNLLKKLDIDPLGVSIDALMLFVRPEHTEEIMAVVSKSGVRIAVVGEVTKGCEAFIVDGGGRKKRLAPLFRESGYTKIKKLVGEKTPADFEKMNAAVEGAYEESLKKRKRVLEYLKETMVP
ncbi:MAG: hypothetical protein MSIBF_03480 [Candidatus Altiarchaeales archaeon IMC4]|nr:MAG: hypothetical protein MSIBF_03480 [Candidatus Altiarchaeales archaeon IMC4]